LTELKDNQNRRCQRFDLFEAAPQGFGKKAGTTVPLFSDESGYATTPQEPDKLHRT
jgi:hypothetical protein